MRIRRLCGDTVSGQAVILFLYDQKKYKCYLKSSTTLVGPVRVGIVLGVSWSTWSTTDIDIHRSTASLICHDRLT